MFFSEIVRFAQIVSINLLLSGDNAILVGMTVLKLPDRQRKIVAVAGVSAASVIQIAATLALASVLHFPAISLIGGLLLEGIAIRFLNEDRSASGETESPRSTWKAIATVFIAYVIVCLDNVMAVAAVGRGHPLSLAGGLAVSCAIVIPGSIFIAELMRRFPVLIFIGAGVLGWTAGGLVTSDPIFRSAVARATGVWTQGAVMILAPALLAALVVVTPYWHQRSNVRG